MRYIIILLITFKILCIDLYSDGCTLPPGCEDKEFPYTFCNSNNIFHKCSKNPYNEWDGNTQLKPMKLDGCFQYDYLTYTFEEKTTEWDEIGVWEFHEIIGYDEFNNPIYGYMSDVPIYEPGTNIEISGYNYGEPITEPYDIHIMHHSKSIITNQTITDNGGNICFNYYKFGPNDYPGTKENADNALSGWMSFCNGCDLNNQYMQHCCVKIAWTKDPFKFISKKYNPKDTPAFTSLSMLPGSMSPCTYDCDKLYVLLNQTDEFTGNSDSDPGNYSQSFFITGSTSKDGWYSLTATFMHEMGHLFGFGDQYEDDQLDCDHSGSIMDGTDFDESDRDLSDDDKCMYMKMYCWDPPVGVEEGKQSTEEIKVYPNPTNNDMINLQFGNPMGINLAYEIISLLGYSVSSGDIHYNENPKTIILGNLASGVYYIILKHDGIQETKRFIISK